MTGVRGVTLDTDGGGVSVERHGVIGPGLRELLATSLGSVRDISGVANSRLLEPLPEEHTGRHGRTQMRSTPKWVLISSLLLLATSPAGNAQARAAGTPASSR